MPNPTPRLTARKSHRLDGVSCMDCGKLEDDMDISDPGCLSSTPKLTADTPETRAKHVMAWPTVDDRTRRMHHMAIVAEIQSAEAVATTKAFEEAVEAKPTDGYDNGGMHDDEYDAGWKDAIAAYTAAIRALAKEQASTET